MMDLQKLQMGQEGDSAQMSRRSVLRMAGLSAATVVVASAAGLTYRTYDQGVLRSGTGPAYDAWKTWEADNGPLGLVAAAILAASPHNTQPWRFAVSKRAIDLYADESRGLGSLDPIGRELHVGLGCALENLVLAAHARGFDAVVGLVPDPKDSTHIASVGLTEAAGGGQSELYRQIPRRHTDRGPYDKRQLEPELLAEMVHTASTDSSKASLRWFTTEGEKTLFGRHLLEATMAIISDEDQSRDGFIWFRASWDDVNRHRDGLTIDAQNMAALKRTAGKLLPASTRAAGDQFWLEQTRDIHIPTAAAFGLITVPDAASTVDRLEGGRLLQRLHLLATARGLGFHHMNQLTERADREQQTGAAPTYSSALAGLIGDRSRQALVAFRIGYPTRRPISSPRRQVGEVLR